MKDIEIPRFVDSQVQVFFWEIDEIVPMVASVGIGIMTGALTYMLIPAFIITKLFSKYKEMHLDGILLHYAYWVGIFPLNKAHDNGQIRRYET